MDRAEDGIVEDAFQLLGIANMDRTDPAIIGNVLDELHLTDLITNNESIRLFLHQATRLPLEIGDQMTMLRRTLNTEYPMIVEFLKVAVANRWLSPSDRVLRAVHVGIVLETLTSAMLDSVDLIEEIRAHIHARRLKYGIRSSNVARIFYQTWRATGRLFLATKIVSIEPALTFFIFQRKYHTVSNDHIKALYDQDKLTLVEYKSLLHSQHAEHRHDGIMLNIMEAGVTEYRSGFQDNALCALVLMQELKIRSLSGHDEISNPLSADWIHLYESWNAAFLLGDLDDLPLILPKLFIPSVLQTSPDRYIEARTFSLWLTISALLFRRLEGKTRVKRGPLHEYAANVWGNINRQYAIQFAADHLGLSEAELLADFSRRFRWPRFGFIAFLIRCIADRR